MFPLAHGIKGISFLNQKLVKFHLADERGTQINLSAPWKLKDILEQNSPDVYKESLWSSREFSQPLGVERKMTQPDLVWKKYWRERGGGHALSTRRGRTTAVTGWLFNNARHYLICWRHSTAEAKQASFVVGKTCVRRMIVREERHLPHWENEGTRGSLPGKAGINMTTRMINGTPHSKDKHVWWETKISFTFLLSPRIDKVAGQNFLQWKQKISHFVRYTPFLKGDHYLGFPVPIKNKFSTKWFWVSCFYLRFS